MKKLVALVLLCIVGIGTIGCAKFQSDDSGKLVNRDFTIIRQSGGVITDVWKVRMSVKPDFLDSGQEIGFAGREAIVFGGYSKTFLTGDIKLMHDKHERYHEYHQEFETETYQEKFKDDNIEDKRDKIMDKVKEVL